jgi:4-methyl-5(b-hydroxyethyl)-thiazole monophosphate biosynthesis
MYKTVLVVLAEGFEDIEAITSIDVVTRAGIKVTISGMETRPVRGAYGSTIIGHTTIDKVEGEFDALVFPGGSECARTLSANARVVKLIKTHHNKGRLIAALCASTNYLLGEAAGILAGRRVTGDPELVSILLKAKAFPVDEHVVIDGNIITGRGPGAALQFALAMVEYLVGGDTADRLASKWRISKITSKVETVKELVN